MWFSADNLVLVVAQAACVAAPAVGLPSWAARFRTSVWALALPASIAVVVAAIQLLPETASALTWIALLLVPAGCALAAGWAARGASPALGAVAVPLLAIAWALPDTRAGELAATILIAGSAVTLGRLLAGAAPLPLIKAGVMAMAAVDAWLVFSGRLEAPNAVLIAASPGHGLPQLQSASFGTAGLGYGDFFAAGAVGGVLAAEGRSQVAAFAGVVVASLCWDQLFLAYDVLPATIPPAVVLAAATHPIGGRRAHVPAVPRGYRSIAILLAGALLFATITPAVTARAVRTSLHESPQATTRDFLSAAIVDTDGFDASRYLTRRARLSFEDHAPGGPTVDTFFGASHLSLGGLAVQSNADLERLSYRVFPAGRDRLVEVEHGGQRLWFRLRPASPTELNEFHAPPTHWRIDSSVAALGRPRPAAADGV